MLEVKNVEVAFLDRAINAIKNSYTVGGINTVLDPSKKFEKGGIAQTLGSNLDHHQSHDAYLKGICVCMDIKYPLYWSPEFQRYHFAEIVMSQSTMHSLKKMLSTKDFSPFNKYVSPEIIPIIEKLVKQYEEVGFDPISTPEQKYEAFMKLRSSLPAGFEMWETVVTNYLQLKTIWIQRHNHKLKEDWGPFCKMIEELPHFKELALSFYFQEKK